MTITQDIEHLDFDTPTEEQGTRQALIEVQRELAVLATTEHRPKFDPDTLLDERMQVIRDDVIYPEPKVGITVNGRIILGLDPIPDYVMMHQSPTPVASHQAVESGHTSEIADLFNLIGHISSICVCTPSRGGLFGGLFSSP